MKTPISALVATTLALLVLFSIASSARAGSSVVSNKDDYLKSPEADDMRARLSDSVARKELRAEQLEHARSQHPDVAEAVGLTADEHERLIALNADWQLEHLDLFYENNPVSGDYAGRFERMQQREKQLNRQLADLLGEDKFSRYQQYQRSVAYRLQLAELNSALPAAQAVQGERKDRFLSLLQAEWQQFDLASVSSEGSRDGAIDTNDPQQYAAEMALREREAMLKALEEFSARLRARAAEVLTANQLARFTEMEEDTLAALRRGVQKQRLRQQVAL